MNYHLNGDEPEIIGKTCCGLCLIQSQEGESVTDPANTVYLKFGANWSKLYFDGGTIFWRQQSPSEPVNDNLENCMVLLNLCELDGVIGYELEKVEYAGSYDQTSAKFSFSSGRSLMFTYHCDEDYTQVTSILSVKCR